MLQDKLVIDKCDKDLTNRVRIWGDYEKNQCGISLSNITLRDMGNWRCEVKFN